VRRALGADRARATPRAVTLVVIVVEIISSVRVRAVA